MLSGDKDGNFEAGLVAAAIKRILPRAESRPVAPTAAQHEPAIKFLRVVIFSDASFIEINLFFDRV